MYYYYKYSGTHKQLDNIYGVSFRKVKPKWNNFHTISWHIMSILWGGEFWEYQLITKRSKKWEIISQNTLFCML